MQAQVLLDTDIHGATPATDVLVLVSLPLPLLLLRSSRCGMPA
jgi:hypothetical protein